MRLTARLDPGDDQLSINGTTGLVYGTFTVDGGALRLGCVMMAP